MFLFDCHRVPRHRKLRVSLARTRVRGMFTVGYTRVFARVPIELYLFGTRLTQMQLGFNPEFDQVRDS